MKKNQIPKIFALSTLVLGTASVGYFFIDKHYNLLLFKKDNETSNLEKEIQNVLGTKRINSESDLSTINSNTVKNDFNNNTLPLLRSSNPKILSKLDVSKILITSKPQFFSPTTNNLTNNINNIYNNSSSKALNMIVNDFKISIPFKNDKNKKVEIHKIYLLKKEEIIKIIKPALLGEIKKFSFQIKNLYIDITNKKLNEKLNNEIKENLNEKLKKFFSWNVEFNNKGKKTTINLGLKSISLDFKDLKRNVSPKPTISISNATFKEEIYNNFLDKSKISSESIPGLTKNISLNVNNIDDEYGFKNLFSDLKNTKLSINKAEAINNINKIVNDILAKLQKNMKKKNGLSSFSKNSNVTIKKTPSTPNSEEKYFKFKSTYNIIIPKMIWKIGNNIIKTINPQSIVLSVNTPSNWNLNSARTEIIKLFNGEVKSGKITDWTSKLNKITSDASLVSWINNFSGIQKAVPFKYFDKDNKVILKQFFNYNVSFIDGSTNFKLHTNPQFVSDFGKIKDYINEKLRTTQLSFSDETKTFKDSTVNQKLETWSKEILNNLVASIKKNINKKSESDIKITVSPSTFLKFDGSSLSIVKNKPITLFVITINGKDLKFSSNSLTDNLKQPHIIDSSWDSLYETILSNDFSNLKVKNISDQSKVEESIKIQIKTLLKPVIQKFITNNKKLNVSKWETVITIHYGVSKILKNPNLISANIKIKLENNAGKTIKTIALPSDLSIRVTNK